MRCKQYGFLCRTIGLWMVVALATLVLFGQDSALAQTPLERELELAEERLADAEADLASANQYLEALERRRAAWKTLADQTARERYKSDWSETERLKRLEARTENVARTDQALAKQADRVQELETKREELQTEAAALRVRLEAEDTALADDAVLEQSEEEDLPVAIGGVEGFWRDADARSVAILPRYNDEISPNELSLYTDERVWQGRYDDSELNAYARPQDTHLRFTYKPRADEMDANLPEWVREAVAGELEWELKFNEYCCPYQLRGEFLPGLLRYPRDGAEGDRVEIVGPGAARTVTLTPDGTAVPVQLPWMDMTIEPVSVRGRGGNGEVLLLRGDYFAVNVIMNEAAAELWGSTGDKLTVAVTTNDGQSSSVSLPRIGSDGWSKDLITFRNRVPMALDHEDRMPARDPEFMKTDYQLRLLGAAPGSRLNIKIGVQTAVTFTLGPAKAEAIVSLNERGPEAIQKLAEMHVLRDTLDERLKNADLTPDARRQLEGQLKLISNLEELLARASGRIGKSVWYDDMRIALLDFYLDPERGVLNYFSGGPRHFGDRGFEMVQGPNGRKYDQRATERARAYTAGTKWVLPQEEFVVNEIRRVRQQAYTELATQIFKQGTLATIDAVASMPVLPMVPIGWDVILPLFAGHDHRGKPVDWPQLKLMLLQAGLGAGSDFATSRALSRPVRDLSNNGFFSHARVDAHKARARLDQNPAARLRARAEVEARNKTVAAAFERSVPADLPQSARASAKTYVAKKASESAGGEVPGSASEAGNAAPPRSAGATADEGFGIMPESRLVKANDGPKQCGGTCNFFPILGKALRNAGLGFDLSEFKAVLIGRLTRAIDTDIGRRFVDGFEDTVIFRVLEFVGLEVRYLAKVNFTIKDIFEQMKNRWGVAVTVDAPDGLHRITIEKITKKGDKFDEVFFRDTGLVEGDHAEIRAMAAPDFLAWLTRDGQYAKPILFRVPEGGISDRSKAFLCRVHEADLGNLPPDMVAQLNRIADDTSGAQPARATGDGPPQSRSNRSSDSAENGPPQARYTNTHPKEDPPPGIVALRGVQNYLKAAGLVDDAALRSRVSTRLRQILSAYKGANPDGYALAIVTLRLEGVDFDMALAQTAMGRTSDQLQPSNRKAYRLQDKIEDAQKRGPQSVTEALRLDAAQERELRRQEAAAEAERATAACLLRTLEEHRIEDRATERANAAYQRYRDAPPFDIDFDQAADSLRNNPWYDEMADYKTRARPKGVKPSLEADWREKLEAEHFRRQKMRETGLAVLEGVKERPELNRQFTRNQFISQRMQSISDLQFDDPTSKQTLEIRAGQRGLSEKLLNEKVVALLTHPGQFFESLGKERNFRLLHEEGSDVAVLNDTHHSFAALVTVAQMSGLPVKLIAPPNTFRTITPPNQGKIAVPQKGLSNLVVNDTTTAHD